MAEEVVQDAIEEARRAAPLDLEPESPAAGHLPIEAGEITLTEAPVTAIHALLPHRGQEESVSDHLEGLHWVPLAPTGRAVTAEIAACLWAGMGRWLILDILPHDIPGASLVDVSDGWAVMDLEGPGARNVLARLAPLDLRDHAFGRDAVAASLLGHADALIWRRGDDGFRLFVWRSMAAGVIEEIALAMARVAARAQRDGPAA